MNFNTVDGTVEWFHSSRALLEQAWEHVLRVAGGSGGGLPG